MATTTTWPEKRSFRSLSLQEIIALAISLEEDDARLYQDFARVVRDESPDLAKGLDELRKEEIRHCSQLMDLHKQRFGEEIPLIRREDISGFVSRPRSPRPGELTPEEVARKVEVMELETSRFYEQAAKLTKEADLRLLFNELAEVERQHEAHAHEVAKASFDPKRASRQLFLLQVIQPGLIGLMDGSVSTLAPLFAAALATENSWETFLVGAAASIGAGISMGFAEGLSDDGSLTGRGKPLARGTVSGVMTFVGGIFHALPFLIANFWMAMWIAVAVVIAELCVIAYIRNRYMQTPFLRSIVQVVIGGLLVFAAGILIGGEA